MMWRSRGHAALFVIGCCAGASSLAATPPARLQGSASAIVAGLARDWLTEFEESRPGTTIDVAPPYGPPQGALSPRLAMFLAGQLDFAFLTRQVASSDVAAFRRTHHYDPLVIPVAGGSWKSFGLVDPVVVVVNARNSIRGLSFAQLDAIFSSSRRRGHRAPRDWSELGSTTSGPIHVAGGASWSSEDSARGGVFRERVMLGGEWRDDDQTRAGGTENDVPARVAADPLAIGFAGLGHVGPGDRVVALARGRSSAYWSPTLSAVASGRYPLARTIDLIVARQPGTCLSPALREFIRYLLSRRGQAVVAMEGHFLQLTSAQRRESWLRATSCR